MTFKQLSDFKGDQAFEVMDELLDPIAGIVKDEEFKKARANKGASVKTLAHKLIKDHRTEIITILAVLSGQSYEDLKDTITPPDIINGVLSIFTDQDMLNLFQ